MKHAIKICLFCLLGLFLICAVVSCGLPSPANPKVVDRYVYDAVVSSVFYHEDAVKVYFPNTTGGGISDGGMWLVNETGQNIRPGRAYHMVIRVVSDGSGPTYYLESIRELE